jgi:hypothetical protein
MLFIERNAVHISAAHYSRLLLSLLGAVVVRLA